MAHIHDKTLNTSILDPLCLFFFLLAAAAAAAAADSVDDEDAEEDVDNVTSVFFFFSMVEEHVYSDGKASTSRTVWWEEGSFVRRRLRIVPAVKTRTIAFRFDVC